MKSTIKNFVGKLHLWLGLITAPIVFFICVTGTIIVFSDEIMSVSAGDAKYVSEVKPEKIPVEEILQQLHQTYPDRFMISYLVAYKNPERSMRFNTYSRETGLSMVYVDPYTGEILKDDKTIYFFFVMAHLHSELLLHKPGKLIVDYAALVFVIELILGLIIWFPKKWDKKHRKAVFAIKWSASAKRRNSDLHKVLGFYSMGVVLVISVTGLLIGFKSWSSFATHTLGGDSSKYWEADFPVFDSTTKPVPINTLLAETFKKCPDKDEVQFYTYNMNKDGFYYVKAASFIGLKSARQQQFLVYNKYTGKEIVLPHAAYANEKIDNAFWFLHMGNWGGLIGKIITFLAGLIASSLPVTGFIIWRRKRKVKLRNEAVLNAI